MAIRLTGISTPIGGVTWEYSENKKQEVLKPVIPDRKINAFISSICGRTRYDDVRAKLKKSIESTKLADVYTFEAEGASSLPAGVHYRLALEKCRIRETIFYCLLNNYTNSLTSIDIEFKYHESHQMLKSYKIKLKPDINDISILIREMNIEGLKQISEIYFVVWDPYITEIEGMFSVENIQVR